MLLRHDAAVVSGHFSHDGSQLVTATTNDGITVWDVASGVPLRTYPCAGNGVNDVLLLPGGRQLFEAGVAFGASALVDLQTERETTTFAMIQAECAAWVPPRRGILIASWDEQDAQLCGAAQLLAQDSLRLCRTYRTGIEGPIGRIAVSRDGARFLAAQACFGVETVATSADAAFLFETDTGAMLRQYAGPPIIHDIVFAPDEQHVVVSGESGLWWWDVQTAGIAGQLPSPYSPLTSLASVSAGVGDSQELAGGSEDGAVVVWRWPDLREICRFHEHTGRVNQVAFAPNAPLVASASEGTTVSLHSLDR